MSDRLVPFLLHLFVFLCYLLLGSLLSESRSKDGLELRWYLLLISSSGETLEFLFDLLAELQHRHRTHDCRYRITRRLLLQYFLFHDGSLLCI